MKKILLLSYPRSGNTFSRYLLEHATGLPSIGYEESDLDRSSVSGGGVSFSQAEGLIVKRHDTKGVIGGEQYRVEVSEYSGVILVLRNPGEAIVRHVGPPKIKAILRKRDRTPEDVKGFYYLFQNMQFFEETATPKLLLSYEDLLSNTEKVYIQMREFADRLGITGKDAVPVDNFMSQIEDHRKLSLSRYGKSQSGGKSGTFHLDALTPSEREKLARLIDEMCPPSCRNMIGNYEVRGSGNRLLYWFRRIIVKLRKKTGLA